MNSLFEAEFFAGNRTKLRRFFRGTAPIVITANGLLQSSADTAYPFRQDSNFWYLTGVDEPDIILIMDKGKEYLIIPKRDPLREVFEGTIKTQELIKKSGISNVLPEEEGWKQLTNKLKRVKHVATLAALPAYVDRYDMYSNPARNTLNQKIKSLNPDIEMLDLRPHLSRLRMIKQPQEITAIQKSVDLTVKSFKTVSKRLEKLKYEFEVEAVFTNAFRKSNAKHAYDPIVASSSNACTLHYTANDRAINSGQLLLIDIGSQVDRYASDITRTYPIGRATKRQQAVINAVADIQEFAKNLLKPGVLLKEYEQQVERFTGEKLRELGLIKSISHEKVRQYYSHATSHFLGLDVHDAGDYKLALSPNVVLTVEPGIYIPKEGIGVRLEDDVIITPGGNEVMSRRLPLMPS